MIPPAKRTPEQQALCELLPMAAIYAEQFRRQNGLDALHARHEAILDAACRLVGEGAYSTLRAMALDVSNDTASEDAA